MDYQKRFEIEVGCKDVAKHADIMAIPYDFMRSVRIREEKGSFKSVTQEFSQGTEIKDKK